jgi:hypothetical protein
MAERQLHQHDNLISRRSQPLFGVILMTPDGNESVHYFNDEQVVDSAVKQSSLQKALSLAGAWRDLDWEAAEQELDRIRHQSQPTPAFEL